MTFKDVNQALRGRVVAQNEYFDTRNIEHIVAGDLMSEVLVAEEENLILITSLSSDQVVRTAHVVDAMGIILVNNKTPQESTVRLAREFGLNIIAVDLPMFECCCAVQELQNKS
jgi:hypothetical protein